MKKILSVILIVFLEGCTQAPETKVPEVIVPPSSLHQEVSHKKACLPARFILRALKTKHKAIKFKGLRFDLKYDPSILHKSFSVKKGTRLENMKNPTAHHAAVPACEYDIVESGHPDKVIGKVISLARKPKNIHH
jgi:hypothetical protein